MDFQFIFIVTVLPFIYGVIFFLVSIFPVLAIVLGLGSIQGKGGSWGVFWGFVTSFTLFRILISLIVKVSEISLDTLQYIGIFFLILTGVMMMFPKYSPWQKVENGFKRGFVYSAFLGFILSFWVGLSKAIFSDQYEPEWIGWLEIYITFVSSISPGLLLVALSYFLSRVYSSNYLVIIERVLGFMTLCIAVLLAFHFVVLMPREGLRFYEPPPKTLKEIFKLK